MSSHRPPRPPKVPVHGWLVFNKPVGMGSTQAVAYIKRIFNAEKAGHGGTLDPLADGVLPIALGEATKTLPYILESDKRYRFTAVFGAETNTDDLEGAPTNISDKRPTQAALEAVLPHFTGDISQVPPAFSAIRVNGQRAYAQARSGANVVLAPRSVTVYSLQLLTFTPEQAVLECHVSKGTYVRSLARDIGRALGCYAHVATLTRLQAGPFSLAEAVSKETLDNCTQIRQIAETSQGIVPSLHTFLKPVEAPLNDISVYAATWDEVTNLKAGRSFVRVHITAGLKKVVSPEGTLVSLVEVDDQGAFKVLRNFNL